MVDFKQGIKLDKIMNYLGHELKVDLKNHHTLVGTLAYYHLQEQMIHLMDWKEFAETDDPKKPKLVREGKFMIVNRTAWFQIYC